MELAIFAIFGVAALVSAIIVVAHRNPVYSVMSMVVTLSALAVLFVMLGAPFIAALQILLYTGAILVLFLFVIMLLNVQRETTAALTNRVQVVVSGLVGLAFVTILGMLTWSIPGSGQLPPLTEELVGIRPLARRLFSEYLLPFEMIGLLLLVAVVAATVLARRPAAGEIPEGDA